MKNKGIGMWPTSISKHTLKPQPPDNNVKSSIDPNEDCSNEERTISVVNLSKSGHIFKKKSQSMSQSQLTPITKVYSDASTGQGDNIKSSPKGFRLNDPKAFRQLFTENRDTVDKQPILSPDEQILNLESGECKTMSSNYQVSTKPVKLCDPGTEKTTAQAVTAITKSREKCKDPLLIAKEIEVLQKTIEDTKPAVTMRETKKRFNVATQCPSLGVFEREVVYLGDIVTQSVPTLNKVASAAVETSASTDAINDVTEEKVQDPRAAKSYHRDSKLLRIINKFRRKKESS